MPHKPAVQHAGETAFMAGWGRMSNGSYPTLLQRVDLNILGDCMGIPQEIEIDKYGRCRHAL